MNSAAPVARRGMLFVISSPSGAGKTSLARRLLADHADLTLSVSATTRTPRPGEQDGRDYYFVSDARFEKMKESGAFLEYAEVHGHLYGSPRAPATEALERGADLLFDVDWQGARAIASREAADTVRVFILPPSMTDLERRLLGRAQDAPAVIQRRLGRARDEIVKWTEYDYVVLNDDLERAYAELAVIYRAERLKRFRNLWMEPLVERLLEEGGPGL